jgi:hypothetical protein
MLIAVRARNRSTRATKKMKGVGEVVLFSYIPCDGLLSFHSEIRASVVVTLPSAKNQFFVPRLKSAIVEGRANYATIQFNSGTSGCAAALRSSIMITSIPVSLGGAIFMPVSQVIVWRYVYKEIHRKLPRDCNSDEYPLVLYPRLFFLFAMGTLCSLGNLLILGDDRELGYLFLPWLAASTFFKGRDMTILFLCMLYIPCGMWLLFSLVLPPHELAQNYNIGTVNDLDLSFLENAWAKMFVWYHFSNLSLVTLTMFYVLKDRYKYYWLSTTMWILFYTNHIIHVGYAAQKAWVATKKEEARLMGISQYAEFQSNT